MKKKFNSKKIIKLLLQLIVYGTVIYFIYDRLNGHIVDLKDFAFQNPKWLLIALGVYSLHSLVNASNWFKMMELSGEKVNLLEQMNVFLKSDVLRYIPGNVVGIMARGVYNKEYGIKVTKTLWGWFLENIIYLVIGIVIGIYSITLLPIDPVYIYLTLTVAVLGGIFGIFKVDWLEFIFKKLVAKRIPEGEVVDEHILNINFLGRIILIFRYFIAWILTVSTFVLVVYAIGGANVEDIFLLASIYAMARSIGYLAIVTPTGGGIREAVIIQLLTMVNGYSFATATIIAVVTRIVFIFGELLSYAIFYIYYMFYKLVNRKKK